MGLRKLPLLGSNQDSPDPESETRSPFIRVESALGRQFASVRDTAHTKTHTIRYTGAECSPVPAGGAPVVSAPRART